MSKWITQEEVATQLRRRYHKAWYLEKAGWRDANPSPTEGELGRQILNFLKLDGYWFKMFIPLTVEVKDLVATADVYTNDTNNGK